MANLTTPPPTRVPVGYVTVGGQRLEVFIDAEWARYFLSLNTQVIVTSSAVGQPGAPGATGAAGAAVSFAGGDAEASVEFVPVAGPAGATGPQGLPLFLLQDDAPSELVMGSPTLTTEAFIAPTLTNSWVNYGAPCNDAGYFKDAAGVVHLRGMVMNGTVGLATPIFTLPQGYRPAAQEVLVCVSFGAVGRVDITPSGSVSLITGSNAWVSLDGLTFRAA